MKKMKKIFAMLIAMIMVLGMSTSVYAASISVERDSTYAGEAEEPGREFTYSEIFRATLSGTNTSSGGGYDADGTPGTITASLAKGYSYYLKSSVDSVQIAQLGSWIPATDSVSAHWEKKDGNLWFDLTPSADGSQYIVSWASGVATDTDAAQAAAQWLAGKTNGNVNYSPISTGKLAWDATSKKWTKTDLEDGYYLVSSDTGDNLIAATGDITVKEKNSYPPLDKKQADEDNAVQTDDDKKVAVGDVLDYEVKVTIPATAAVGETIVVYDAPSDGLTYDSNSMKITVDGTEITPATNAQVASAATQTGEAWRYTITVNEDNKGKDVVFKFKMTVNESALTDSSKMNTSGLVYNDYESNPDKVKFKTYYTGIEKVDGSDPSKKLKDVEFTLKEAGTEFKVKKVTVTGGQSYYVPDANGSSTVVTDEKGLIIIRGLDDDKTYTLTETKTNDGYNLLEGDKTLVLSEDGFTIPAEGSNQLPQATYDPTTSFAKVENNQGTVLPSTGGIGTTIFYVVGAILVASAGVVLVTRRRMNVQ